MDVIPTVQSDASTTNHKPKPAVPKKPVKLMSENDVNRTTHVRDMIRKLQEKEHSNGNIKPTFLRMGGKAGKVSAVPDKEDTSAQASIQTMEDLKAIDEDIEKLRKQIEERDKIISALREAAEAKDKKLDNLMVEYSKLQSNGKLELDTSPEPNRTTSSSPSPPPLCNGELCWTDSFVNKNYHEPVYAQLLNDHAALQKVYNDLRAKLESKGEDFGLLKDGPGATKTDTAGGNKLDGGENAINLIMAEQIRVLKEREAQLIWEAEELREQNDLMEFRILELEESRKEFLDKEVMNEGKHRPEKIVWRERDLEEISDSGVMSLPTSEDLTSDSELGEAIRNYSPLGAVTNLGLSTSEISHLDPVGITDLKLKKSLKSSECLQESGIFVDSDSPSDCAIPAGTHSKACQTESVLDKTLLDLIDSSCDFFLSKNPGYLEEAKLDDLSTEISKLSVIQKRIQQKTSSPTPKSPHTVESCPHWNSVSFYEERLGQLEEKLKIYESSGDTKDLLLAKRLQKEVELAHRVKELTDKVVSLEATNRKLEEEKCEFEEAENDTRFQCQRLEVRLQELIEKNTELEVELERHKVIMNKEKRKGRKKGSLEGLLSQYDQRNFELEEKEEEAKHRLSMIEAAMPAIVAFNVFKMVQNPEFANMLPPATISENAIVEKSVKTEEPTVYQRLEEAFSDQKKAKKDTAPAEDTETEKEKALRNKIKELEEKAAKDRDALEEMTNTLKTYKMVEKSDTENNRPDEGDLFEELKQMVENEMELRVEIERLKKKEKAYVQSLENADEIWAGMEADYKRRLTEAEDANRDLQKRIAHLEETQAELAKTITDQPLFADEPEKDFQVRIQELLVENKKLKAEISRNLDEKFEEHRKFLEVENKSLKEELKKMESDSVKGKGRSEVLEKQLELMKLELEREKEAKERLRRDLEEKSQSVTSMENNLQSQISELTQELNQKSKELSSLEVTVAELREEVETLENKVSELVETIQTTIKNKDEVSKASKEIQHWSLPVDGTVCHTVCVSLPRPEDAPREVAETKLELPVGNEIIFKAEVKVPSLEVLIPRRFSQRFLVFAAPFYPRQEGSFLFPCSSSTRKLLVKTVLHSPKMIVLEVRHKQERNEAEMRAREEELFQLSIKNTELQQTLERMEEESKQKDKEFEELQRIALEIRQEQINLEALYEVTEKNVEVKGGQPEAEPTVEEIGPNVTEQEDLPPGEPPSEEPKRTPSIEILQVINPIVVKTSEEVSATFSSLQIAMDNLLSKYRSTALMLKPVLDQLKQRGDNRDMEELVKRLSLEFSSSIETRQKTFEGHPTELDLNVDNDSTETIKTGDYNKTRSSTPKSLGKSSSVMSYPVLVPPARNYGHRAVESDPEFSFAAPITTVRKVGDDGIFLEWDVSHQPPNVTGFEIKVNGLLTHRVRSSTRNKALLRPLNLNNKISIHLYATSGNGRSTRSSHVTYPNEIFFH